MLREEVERMLERHRDSAPEEVELIGAGLSAGTCTHSPCSPGSAPGRELLATYEVKAWSVSRFDTQHARRLHADTKRLCEKLSAAGDVRCRTWSFDLQHGRSLVVFENQESGEFLGILRLVSRTRTTPEEWAALWGTDVEAERAYRRLGGSMVRSDEPDGESP